MKKFLVKGMLFSMLAFAFVSCDSDDDDIIPSWVAPEITAAGVYILNSGSQGDNNSTLGYYNSDTKEYTEKIFENQNDDLKIGDTGNDMVIYGSKMYILATNSNKIYITNLASKLLKIIEPINQANQPQKPREGIAHGGKVYVTLFDGYVAQIDTTSMTIAKTVQVGTYPEELTVADNKLYVANSGYGKGNTVSQIDLNSFTVSKTIDVVVNPNRITSDKDGNIYIISWGNYTDISSALQKYNPTTGEIVTLDTDIVTKMALNKNNDKLFLLSESWATGSRIVTLQSFDIKTNTLDEKSFVNAPSNIDLSKTYSLTINHNNGDIYIATSDYSTNGDMHIFSADGTYKTSLDTGGINPMGAYFITGTK